MLVCPPLTGCASAAFAEVAINSTPVMRRSIHRRRRVQIDHRNAKRPQLRCRRRRRGVSGAMGGIFAANADGAVLLALLIGLQNLPEGFIVVFRKSAAKYKNGGFEVNIPVKDEVKCLGYRWMGNCHPHQQYKSASKNQGVPSSSLAVCLPFKAT